MLLIIDNYDSFTYNLVHYALELGARVEVRRNDALSAAEALAMAPDAILMSPGPGTPDDAGICVELVRAAPETLPMLGVCLGHQAIGQALGGRVIQAKSIMHGKTSRVRHDGSGVFAGLESPFTATRYHSLAVARDGLPDSLIVNADAEDGEIMGFRHESRPLHGVQFHPESIATEHGHALLDNFLSLARGRAAA